MAVTSKSVKWGRYRAPGSSVLPNDLWDDVAAGTIRLTVLQPVRQAFWVQGIGIQAGAAVGGLNPTLRLGMYETDQDKEPLETENGTDTVRMGYTASVVASTTMSNRTGGTQHELDFSVVDYGPSVTAVLLPAGYRPAVGPLPTSAGLGIAYAPLTITVGTDTQDNPAALTDNRHWYEKLGLAQPPPVNVDGIVDQGEFGPLEIWIYGVYNEPPQDPVSRSVTNLSSLTPTFTWDFRDNNGAWGASNGSGVNVGDVPRQSHIQVRRKSDGQSMGSWTHAATTDEKTNNAFAVVYQGSVLSRGIVYQWRVRHQDQAEAWTDWAQKGTASEWLDFTLNQYGTVTLDGAPQSTIQQNRLITYNGKYTHTAATAADRLQIQILTRANKVIKTSPEFIRSIASSAAPGTAFTIAPTAITSSSVASPTVITTSAAHGLSTGDEVWIKDHSGSTPSINGKYAVTVLTTTTFTIPVNVSVGGTGGFVEWAGDLDWGETYKYQIRARDTGGNWSNYSGRRQFKTDAPPSTPTDVRPDGTVIFTNLPELSAIVTDADDDLATGVTTTVEITRPNASVITRTMVYDASAPNADGTTGRFEYQMVAGDLVGGSEYGTYSIRVSAYDGTVYSGGTTSAGSRAWSDVETFQYLLGPTVTITTPTEGQTVTTTAVHFAWTSSTSQLDAYNRTLYDAASGIQVYPPKGLFFPAVATTDQFWDVPASYVKNGGDYYFTFVYQDVNGDFQQGPRYFHVAYTPPADVTNLSVRTKPVGNDPWDTAIEVSWDISALDTFGGYLVYRSRVGETVGPEHLQASIENASQTSYLDLHAPAGVDWVYTVRQRELKDTGEVVESTGVSSSARLTFYGTVLVSVTDADKRCHFQYFDEAGRKEVPRFDAEEFFPVDGGPPTVFESPGAPTRDYSVVAQVVTDPWGISAQARKDDVDAVIDYKGTYSVRDERYRTRFMRLVSAEITDRRPDRYTVSMTLRDANFTPTVA